MGILSLIYSAVIFIDGRGKKYLLGALLFHLYAVGAFALLPYLPLSEPNPDFQGGKNILIKILDSRLTGIILR